MNDDIKPTTQASFAQYGKSFQEKLCQALLVDKQFAEQMLEVFNVTYLEPKYLVFLAERYFSYAQKYKVFPTMQLLITIIRDELKIGTDVVIRDQIVDYLQRMRSNPDVEDNLVLLAEIQHVNKKALIVMIALENDDAHALYAGGADYVVLPHLAGGHHLAKILVDKNHLEMIEKYKARDMEYLK
jgi:hypothetical protein